MPDLPVKNSIGRLQPLEPTIQMSYKLKPSRVKIRRPEILL